MTLIKQILFFFTLSIIILACNAKTSKTESTGKSSALNQSNKEIIDGLPPFKDSCLCTFQKFGVYKISNSNFNVYYSGKGWNPKYNSCTYSWGEIKYNENPNDTTVTYLKIHLIDLEKFILPNNMTEYGNDSIKKYVIAICSYDYKNNKRTCTYDPFVTGKYSGPAEK